MTTHLRMPLQVSPTGRLATVADGSVEDVEQSLALLAATAPGERLSVPQYGTRQLLFAPGAPGGLVEALRAAAVTWEPRAGGYRFAVDTDGDTVTVSITGTLPGNPGSSGSAATLGGGA